MRAEIPDDIGSERERQAWRLRMQGWTQQQIADELGVSQVAISYALKRISQKLAEQFREEAQEQKAQQTEQLMVIYREALQQWKRSCDDAERNQVIRGRATQFQGMVVEMPDLETLTTEGQSGNPALLAQAMKALADIRSVWGLDEPAKVQGELTVHAKWYGRDTDPDAL